ncbi:MAG: DUF3631 domain-containing protein [Deltaproteobacteria bacterium]|nr:DUF3631 domain-containing protein [Deltaproteobacteria bacterium]
MSKREPKTKRSRHNLSALGLAALDYAKMDLAVFPLKPGGKEPLISSSDGGSGYLDATTDTAQIIEWWSAHPNANIGMACDASGLVAIDEDPRAGGTETLQRLVAELGPLPRAWCQVTGGDDKGRHRLFEHPGGDLRRQLGPGVDVKGKGYVVVAPSVHPSGRAYRWEVAPDDAPRAELPVKWGEATQKSDQLRNRAQAPAAPVAESTAYGIAAMKAECEALRAAPEGDRNNTLNASAFKCGQLVAGGELSADDAFDELRQAALDAGLSAPEVDATLRSGWEAGLKEPRSAPEKDLLAPLRALTATSTHEDIEAALRALSASCAQLDRLGRVSVREAAIQHLKSNGICAPAQLVDAALAGAGDTIEIKIGRSVGVTNPHPWPEPVDGATVLEELRDCVQRYVVLPARAAVALALWVVFTYVYDEFDVCPNMAVVSPLPRCGKTTLLTLCGALVSRPLPTSNISAAALFRIVTDRSPSLLVDEADTFMVHNEELRGIVNSGHTKANAHVIRASGEDNEPQVFSTWCPKMIALIGRLQPTLHDRSVMISLKRKGRADNVERLRLDRLKDLVPLRRKIVRWAADNLSVLAARDPVVPEDILNDRARDNWRPLLAIAEACGAEWAERARRAAVNICADNDDDDLSAAALLLEDLHDIFTRRKEERLGTRDILLLLNEMEERPWPEFSRGQPLSAAGLAKLLKPFDIKPDKWTEGSSFQRITVRGYRREDLQDAFSRYLKKC